MLAWEMFYSLMSVSALAPKNPYIGQALINILRQQLVQNLMLQQNTMT